jgi:hypothetical protein
MCTTGDTCQGGVCTAGTPKTCNNGDACHFNGTCDPGTGSCSAPPNRPDGTVCDDQSMCTNNDSCQGGTCQGTLAVICDPTLEICDPGTGMCVAIP